MKKSANQNSIQSEKKIDKILGHKIITEFDSSTKCYYNIKKYKVKWADNPRPKWELELDLEKYETVLNKYNKLYKNNEKHRSLSSKEYAPTFYSEYNMRLDNTITLEDNDLNLPKKNNENIENGNLENKIIKKRNNKLYNKNKFNNSKEKLSEIIEINENENSNEENDNNLSELINDMKKNQKKSKKLIKNLPFSPDYNKFGPNFDKVLNAYNNKIDKNKENKENIILLNKKRNLSNSTDSFTISIEGENSESKISDNSNKSNNINKIYKIIVPKDKTDNISILYKNNLKEKKLIRTQSNNFSNLNKDELLKGYEYIIKSNLNKISKEELLKFYEQIIKNNLSGNTYDIDL